MPIQTTQPVWRPNPGPQEEALRHQEFEILYGGARGGGKTDAGIVWMLDLIEVPNARGLALRKNSEDLKDWIDRANRIFSSQGAVQRGNPAEFVFPSGYTIRTGHLKDDQAFTKYQGHEYHRLLIEELTQIPTEQRYIDLLSSCRSTIEGVRPKVFGTTNPGGVGHSWVKARWRIPDDFLNVEGHEVAPGTLMRDPDTNLSRVFIPAKVEDNPILMQKDPNYVHLLESQKAVDPEKYKAWRHGDWGVFVGQFFKGWDIRRHVVEPFEVPAAWRKWVAYDWGYASPMACEMLAMDYEGRIWVWGEVYGTQMTEQEQGEAILSVIAGRTMQIGAGDPSIWAKTRQNQSKDTKSVADTLLDMRIKMQPANNDRVQGWQRVRTFLKDAPACDIHKALGWETCPNIHVFNNCRDLIRTIPNQVFDDHNKEDLDTDGEDHAVDALRYGLMSVPAGTSAPSEAFYFEGVAGQYDISDSGQYDDIASY